MSEPVLRAPSERILELESELKTIRAEEKEVNSRLAFIREKARLKAAEIAEAKFGVAVGSIVKCKGKEFRVCNVKGDCYGKPWVHGYQRLKGGAWGSQPRALYTDWELT